MKYSPNADSPLHSLTLDMTATNLLSSFCYLPHQDSALNVAIDKYAVSLNQDGNKWAASVAKGHFSSNDLVGNRAIARRPQPHMSNFEVTKSHRTLVIRGHVQVKSMF